VAIEREGPFRPEALRDPPKLLRVPRAGKLGRWTQVRSGARGRHFLSLGTRKERRRPLWGWNLFGANNNERKNTMTTSKKTVFIAFAIEDERQRDFLKGQSLNTNSPFEYIDMSVREAYETDWTSKVRTRIRRSDGVIALVSSNSLTSTGQKWEIECSKAEGKPLLGIWAYKDDRTNVVGVRTVGWTWAAITSFIDGL
jgi:hypothetical protein